MFSIIAASFLFNTYTPTLKILFLVVLFLAPLVCAVPRPILPSLSPLEKAGNSTHPGSYT